MTITAKYSSICPSCNGPIRAGDLVEWSKGTKARHAKCPTVKVESTPKTDVIRISGGSGYGCQGWEVGQVIVNKGRVAGSTIDNDKVIAERIAAWRAANPEPSYVLWDGSPALLYAGTPEQLAANSAAIEAWKVKTDFAARAAEWQRVRAADDNALNAAKRAARADLPAHNGPEYLLILTAKSRYVREDGLSFGVGDDSGTLYSATARAATDEESAPLRERLGLRSIARDAAIELLEIVETIRSTGERPDKVAPAGLIAWERSGGSGGYLERIWIDETGGRIWYDRYNGADGDDWRANNCGGYAIVTGVPWSETLAHRITVRAQAVHS